MNDFSVGVVEERVVQTVRPPFQTPLRWPVRRRRPIHFSSKNSFIG